MNIKFNKFEKNMKIKIKNKSYYEEAFTHKSANYKKNNEKLEFLGDRVIALVLSKKLFYLYPNETEGILDKRFAKLVNRETCASIAWHNKFMDFVIIGDKQKIVTQKDEKILSDLCEAIIGAIYIDRGIDYVEEVILRLWKNYIDKSNVTILDSKTELQEYSLKLYKKLPIYKLKNYTGPRHNPTFKISVSINESNEFIGAGSSKKIAEQNAASKLLKNIKIK